MKFEQLEPRALLTTIVIEAGIAEHIKPVENQHGDGFISLKDPNEPYVCGVGYALHRIGEDITAMDGESMVSCEFLEWDELDPFEVERGLANWWATGPWTFKYAPDHVTSIDKVMVNTGQPCCTYEWRIEIPDDIFATPDIVGDVDGDGAVDFADFLLLSANFGTESDVGDLNSDGAVDFADFLILSGEFE